jgi:tight adherence protein C
MEFIHNINAMITESLGPMGPLIVVGGLGLVLVLVTLPVMLTKRADPLDKLRETTRKKTPEENGAQGPMKLRTGGKDKLEKFSTFLEPQDATQLSSSRLKMLRAGYRSKNAVRTFHAAQFVLGIGGLILGVLYVIFTSVTGETTTQSMIIGTILPAGGGYYLPAYWVNRRVKIRETEIVSGFPDALDLMLVCVEAGQSLDQSILRVATEIKVGYPALAEEFEIVAHEIKAGKERVVVLKDMSERVGVPDVSSFVTTLVQSATYGTSIAEALRVYAAEMRDKRVMRAEEKANVLPTKLTLGTMLFTIPPLMIILIGPSVYGIVQMLNNTEFMKH